MMPWERLGPEELLQLPEAEQRRNHSDNRDSGSHAKPACGHLWTLCLLELPLYFYNSSFPKTKPKLR